MTQNTTHNKNTFMINGLLQRFWNCF